MKTPHVDAIVQHLGCSGLCSNITSPNRNSSIESLPIAMQMKGENYCFYAVCRTFVLTIVISSSSEATGCYVIAGCSPWFDYCNESLRCGRQME